MNKEELVQRNNFLNNRIIPQGNKRGSRETTGPVGRCTEAEKHAKNHPWPW